MTIGRLQVYLRGTRRAYGIGGFESGREYYSALLKWHSSDAVQPTALYDDGVEEVKRLRASMESVRDGYVS